MVREEKTQDTETGHFNDIDKEILIVLQGAPSGLTIKDLANSLGIKTFLEARRIWDLIRWYEFKAALKRLAEKGIIEKGSEDRIKLRSIEKPVDKQLTQNTPTLHTTSVETNQTASI